MKLKIVGEVKIGPYADNWCPGTLMPTDNVEIEYSACTGHMAFQDVYLMHKALF